MRAKRDDVVARFAHVDTWVFDLDNTLYPAECELWRRVDARMTLFIERLLGLDAVSARALQKDYYRRYGTTLRGLMLEHDVPAQDFLAFAHDIDRSDIARDEVLAAAIGALPGRRLILTNGSRDHALRTTETLGLAELFEDVFDIVAAEFEPKPAEANYQRFFDKHAVEPARAAMFEDIAHNLSAPHARGMRTVLVLPRQGGADHREPWEIAPRELPTHVDFATDDLSGFLRALRSAD